MKKALSIIATVLIITSVFSACSQTATTEELSTTKEPTLQEQIIGHWELIDRSGIFDGGFPTENIYFYENGQMSANGMNMTYSINETTLTIASAFYGSEEYRLTIDGDTMQITCTDDSCEGNYERLD